MKKIGSIPRLDNPTVDCPHCGSIYTGHGEVEVWNRATEDADTGLHARVHSGGVAVDTDMTDNPSPRRQGLAIELDCEECGGKSALVIWQHKGETRIATIKEEGSD